MDNDLRIVKESHMEMTFDSQKTAGMLLYLLAPLNIPQTKPERECSPILHTNDFEIIRVMKRIFTCLHFGLRLKPSTVFAVMRAFVVLHNIARQ